MPEAKLTLGVQPHTLDCDVTAKLDQCDNSGHDFLVVPISHPSFREKMEQTRDLEYMTRIQAVQAPFTSEDLFIRTAKHCERLVGLTSTWVRIDSPDEWERYMAERVLEKELSWSAHIGLSAVLMPMLSAGSDRFTNYARLLCRLLHDYAFLQIWIRIPLLLNNGSADPNEPANSQNSWEQWALLKQLCDHSPRLQLALEITADLPDPKFLNQWYAEPVKCLILPTTTFTTNAKGFPVLSKAHQNFIQRLTQLTHYAVIEERQAEDSVCEIGNHQKFLRYLVQNPGELSTLESFAAGYKDYLQAPLQPLMDHLESATYATFEQDPVKYQLYEKAVYQALMDRFPSTTESDHTCVIFVVGAGRGPLVDRSLAAARLANRHVRVYALEKNPNAYVTLQRKKETTWHEQVTVVFGDMRFWNPPEQADMLVSELLGSFGDNELSPECLDGAQRLLRPGGISIPSSYASFVAPLSSSKLYSQVLALNGPSHFQTPFVVLFDAVDTLYPPQKVWQFNHPNPLLCTGDLTSPGLRSENQHNARYAVNTFSTDKAAFIHGMAGYFDCVLYKDITMSIRPSNHTPAMFSWFPIFFPLNKPIFVPKDAVVETHLWRLTSSSKVWYEWCMVVKSTATGAEAHSTPLASTTIHNLSGSSYWIGL
ncbi:hypothetical protein IWQ61_007969 [Dispira simplex]|nr:hypothetical protein IWQ61_007969 [Dispira simplex]